MSDVLTAAQAYLASVIPNPDSHKKSAIFRIVACGVVIEVDKDGWCVERPFVGTVRKDRYAAPLANLQAVIVWLEGKA